MIKKFFDKVYIRFFISLFLVAALMFTVNCIVYKNSSDIIYGQVERQDKVLLKSIVESYDRCFKEAGDTINSITSINLSIYNYGGYQNLDMGNVFSLYNEVKPLAAKDYIFDFVLFFKDSNLAVTSLGSINFTSLFNQRFKSVSHAAEFWKNYANNKHDLQVIPSSYYTETASDGSVYKRKLIGIVGSNKLNHSDVNVIIFLDEEKIAQYASGDSTSSELSVTVLDQDMNTVLSSGQRDMSAVISRIFFPKGTTEVELQQGENAYYCVKSTYNGFTYVTTISHDTGQTGMAVRGNRLVIAAQALLGLVLCILLSFYLRRPIRKLSLLTANKSDGSTDESYGGLYSAVEQLQSDVDFYKERVGESAKDVRRSVFLRAVDGVVYDGSVREKMGIYFNAVFRYDRYAMLLLLFEKKPAANQDNENDRDMITPDVLEDRIRHCLEQSFQSLEVVYLQDMTYVVLFGLDKRAVRLDILEAVRDQLKILGRNTGSRFRMAGALSGIYTDIAQCKNAFCAVQMGISHNSLKYDNVVIDCENPNIASDIYFPPDYVEKLSNCILNGNRETSKEIVHDIIDKNIQENISSAKFSNIVGNVFYNIINTLHFCRYDKAELVKMEREFYEASENIKNYADIKAFFDKIIDRSTASISLGKKGKLSKEFVVAYIHLHYDEELCLETMAEMTETSSKYFSNFFKKAVGVNFVEYLTKIRIQHAKELLRMTKLNISDVGAKVGFSNLSTFTSTFKKYTGGSPSEFRKSMGGKK